MDPPEDKLPIACLTETDNEHSNTDDIWSNAKTNTVMKLAIEENTKKQELLVEQQVPLPLWQRCNVCHSCLPETFESIRRISLNTGVLLQTLCQVPLFFSFFSFPLSHYPILSIFFPFLSLIILSDLFLIFLVLMSSNSYMYIKP